MKWHRVVCLAACALMGLGFASSARANIIFTAGDHPQPGEQNVLLNNGTSGSAVTGTTNSSGETVVFSSATQTLSEPSNGAARIEAINSRGHQVALSDISSITLATGNYHDLIFNAHIGGTIGTAGGTETVSVLDNLGKTSTFTMTLGNGQNFLTIVATGGEQIVSTSISYPTGFTDLRQVRISTLGTSVPEPSTMVLAGSSVVLLAAYGLRRRRVS